MLYDDVINDKDYVGFKRATEDRESRMCIGIVKLNRCKIKIAIILKWQFIYLQNLVSKYWSLNSLHGWFRISVYMRGRFQEPIQQIRVGKNHDLKKNF